MDSNTKTLTEDKKPISQLNTVSGENEKSSMSDPSLQRSLMDKSPHMALRCGIGCSLDFISPGRGLIADESRSHKFYSFFNAIGRLLISRQRLIRQLGVCLFKHAQERGKGDRISCLIFKPG